MNKVMEGFAMSLDGFIAESDDDVQPLFRWYFNGDIEYPVPGTDLVFKVSRATADLLRDLWPSIGAFVTGRHNFDVANAWGGTPPLGVPVFVVTHHPPQEWIAEGSPFTFVTSGVASAIAQAGQAAGDRTVAVAGTTIVQQCLDAELLDELYLNLVPVLLGAGVRLFDNLTGGPVELECLDVIEAPGVTHLHFRAVK